MIHFIHTSFLKIQLPSFIHKSSISTSTTRHCGVWNGGVLVSAQLLFSASSHFSLFRMSPSYMLQSFKTGMDAKTGELYFATTALPWTNPWKLHSFTLRPCMGCHQAWTWAFCLSRCFYDPGNSWASHLSTYRRIHVEKHVARARKWEGSSAGNEDTGPLLSWMVGICHELVRK